jgi:hypothetical protein
VPAHPDRRDSSSIIALEKMRSRPERTGPRFCITALDVGDSSDTLDNRPGTRPDVRMAGNDVILVLPVVGLPKPHPRGYLVLRFDPDGEVFAAMSRRPDDSGSGRQ